MKNPNFYGIVNVKLENLLVGFRIGPGIQSVSKQLLCWLKNFLYLIIYYNKTIWGITLQSIFELGREKINNPFT
jgi:hypothetical protein